MCGGGTRWGKRLWSPGAGGGEAGVGRGETWRGRRTAAARDSRATEADSAVALVFGWSFLSFSFYFSFFSFSLSLSLSLFFFFPVFLSFCFPQVSVLRSYRWCACFQCPFHTFLCCGLRNKLLELNRKIVRRWYVGAGGSL